jgi:hypothetical protein
MVKTQKRQNTEENEGITEEKQQIQLVRFSKKKSN